VHNRGAWTLRTGGTLKILTMLAIIAASAIADVVITELESVQCDAVGVDAKNISARISGVGLRLFPIGEVRQILLDDARRADDMAALLKGTGIVVGIVRATDVSSKGEARPQPTPSTLGPLGAPASAQGVLSAQGAVFTPIYMVREKNPGEAALYSLIGLPGVVPLGQLYNGEMAKAGGILVWKLVSLAVAGLGYALASKGGSSTPIPDEVYIPILLGTGSYVAASCYSVFDAAVSAERINRSIWEAHPELKFGWAIGF